MKEASKAKSDKKEEAVSYGDAVAELEAILAEIESGDTDVDILTEKVRRALFLIRLCRTRLRNTDDEVKKIMKEFTEDDESKD